jgi:hypothetical protein
VDCRLDVALPLIYVSTHPYPTFLLSSLRCFSGHVSRSAIPPITMSTFLELNPKQNEQSSQGGQAKSAANELTIEGIRSWDKNKLLLWIQQKLSAPLEPKDIETFLDAAINGSVFLRGADKKEFFQRAGLSFGASFELAELARKTIGSKSKCCRSTLYTLR